MLLNTWSHMAKFADFLGVKSVDFSHIKYGVLVAMMAILFGGVMGLSFGCCEDTIKDIFKLDAEEVLSEVYQ